MPSPGCGTSTPPEIQAPHSVSQSGLCKRDAFWVKQDTKTTTSSKSGELEGGSLRPRTKWPLMRADVYLQKQTSR